jgi:hypothetical protein
MRAGYAPQPPSTLRIVPAVQTLLVSGLIICLAAFVQSTTGFGFALVAVPLLAMVMEPQRVVVSVTAVSLLLSAWVGWRHRAALDREAVIGYTWTGLLGMPVGLLVLLVVPSSALKILVGVVVLLAVAGMLLRFRVCGRGWQIAAGLLGGALLTSTGMNGPPIVIGLDARALPPARFRATLQAIFALQGVVALGLFAASGLVDREVGLLVLADAVALPIGWRLGTLLFHRLSPRQFRIGVLSMLVLSASVALLTAR